MFKNLNIKGVAQLFNRVRDKMVQPVVYDKPRGVTLEELNANALIGEVDALFSRLENKEAFAQDLNYLRRHGIEQKQLRLLLNTGRVTIYYWTKALFLPRNRRHILIVRELARCLREREAAHREAMLKPVVSQR